MPAIPFIIWTVVVCVALVTTYFVDPYIFGLTVMLSAGGTGLAGLIGLAVVLFSRTAGRGSRIAIVAALAVAAAAVAGALAILGTFKWA